MLLSKAKALTEQGRGKIINGRLHLFNPTDVGYDRAPGFARLGGAQSGYAGPKVMQFHRRNRGRPGGSDGVEKIKHDTE
mgnify:CR=1 FL=1